MCVFILLIAMTTTTKTAATKTTIAKTTKTVKKPLSLRAQASKRAEIRRNRKAGSKKASLAAKKKGIGLLGFADLLWRKAMALLVVSGIIFQQLHCIHGTRLGGFRFCVQLYFNTFSCIGFVASRRW